MSKRPAYLPLLAGLVLVATIAACGSGAPTPTSPAATPIVLAHTPASATVAASVTSTPLPSTVTPTATPTARSMVGRVSGTVVAGHSDLALGGCTEVRWSVPLGRAVTLDGDAVAPTGARQVCPPQTTTYVLAWANPDGSQDSTSVTVTVTAPTAPPATERRRDEEAKTAPSPLPASSTPAPPTATDCGDECDPWSPPWPTDTPGTQPTAEATELVTAEPSTEP